MIPDLMKVPPTSIRMYALFRVIFESFTKCSLVDADRLLAEVLDQYIATVRGQVADGSAAEQFKIGSRKQISLLNAPRKYDFEVYNIAANGRMHTGKV